MDKTQFVTAMREAFGSCTSVYEAHEIDELVDDYNDWLSGYGSTLAQETDSVESRREYATHLLDIEGILLERESLEPTDKQIAQRQAFLAEIAQRVEQFSQAVEGPVAATV